MKEKNKKFWRFILGVGAISFLDQIIENKEEEIKELRAKLEEAREKKEPQFGTYLYETYGIEDENDLDAWFNEE